MLSLAALCGPDIWYCGFNSVGSNGDSTQRFSIADSPIALDNVVPSGAFDLFEAGLSSLAFFSVSPLGTLQFLLLLCLQLVVLTFIIVVVSRGLAYLLLLSLATSCGCGLLAVVASMAWDPLATEFDASLLSARSSCVWELTPFFVRLSEFTCMDCA